MSIEGEIFSIVTMSSALPIVTLSLGSVHRCRQYSGYLNNI